MEGDYLSICVHFYIYSKTKITLQMVLVTVAYGKIFLIKKVIKVHVDVDDKNEYDNILLF